MIFSRITVFLFALVSLGLLVRAKPVDTSLSLRNDGLAIRTYPATPCHCGQDVVDVLVKLKVDVAAQVALLHGGSPGGASGPCNQIVILINAAVKLIAEIDLKTPFLDVEISACVSLLVDIILNILAGVGLYLPGLIAGLIAGIDVALAALISICIKLGPGIGLSIVLNVDLLAHVSLLGLLGFVKTLLALLL